MEPALVSKVKLNICIYKRNLGAILSFSTPSNNSFPAQFKIEFV